MTEKEKKVTVKSTKFVGTHILAKAKVSIIHFANDVNDTFDPAKNLMMADDMKAMNLRKIIPSMILTDTDSVYFNFLGIFNCIDPKVTEEYFQTWIRESIICYNIDRVDTSNLKNCPYKNIYNKKKLDMFQFDTSISSTVTVVAVNPKEYYCKYANTQKVLAVNPKEYYGKDTKTQKALNKHKGIPGKITLDYEDYSSRVRSFDYLKCHEQALKSSSVTYAQMMKK